MSVIIPNMNKKLQLFRVAREEDSSFSYEYYPIIAWKIDESDFEVQAIPTRLDHVDLTMDFIFDVEEREYWVREKQFRNEKDACAYARERINQAAEQLDEP